MGIAVDVILIVVLIACIIAGASKGAARTLAGLVGLVAAVLLSPRLGTWIAGLLPAAKTTEPFALKLLCTVVAFIMILILAGILGHLLNLACRLPVLHTVNRVFGGIFGGVKGVIAVLLICALLRLALPVLAVKYPDKVQLSSFSNSAFLRMQESPVSAASSKAKTKPQQNTADNLKKAGNQIQQKVQQAIQGLPKSVTNPVYSLYDNLLRGDVKANANKK